MKQAAIALTILLVISVVALGISILLENVIVFSVTDEKETAAVTIIEKEFFGTEYANEVIVQIVPPEDAGINEIHSVEYYVETTVVMTEETP